MLAAAFRTSSDVGGTALVRGVGVGSLFLLLCVGALVGVDDGANEVLLAAFPLPVGRARGPALPVFVAL